MDPPRYGGKDQPYPPYPPHYSGMYGGGRRTAERSRMCGLASECKGAKNVFHFVHWVAPSPQSRKLDPLLQLIFGFSPKKSCSSSALQ